MSIVNMKKVVKRYDESKIVLDLVDFEIKEGEILGLLGPNGAGKTTLIHALAGIHGIDSGSIELFNLEQSKNLKAIKQQIGLVTQDITIHPDLTAEDNLKFFGGIYGLKKDELKKRVQEVLEFVGLTEHAKRYPKTFSGGMQRRLNIACSLVHNPKLVIMDEPTVGVDPQSRNHILESIKKLNKHGTTILYTTHYIEEIESIASKVVIIDKGHIITQGTVSDLVKHIQHEEKTKIEVGNLSSELIDKIKSLPGVKQVSEVGKELHIISQVGAGNIDRILSIAKEYGGIKSITTEKPTLEDVFLTLTGKNLRDGGDD